MTGSDRRSGVSVSWRRTTGVVLTVAAWVVAAWVIWLSVQRGRELQRTDPEIFLGAAPLVGRNFRDGWDWRFGISLIGAGALAAGLVIGCWSGRWTALRLRWVVASTAVGAMAFAVLLALTDGADGLLYGADHDTEYLANLPALPAAGEFLRTFVERLPDYSVHARGHPPGFLLVLIALDAVGIGGAWTTALLSVLATGAVAAGMLVVVHAVAGPEWVRRAAPFLVVSPYLIWMVTSADAVYSALGVGGTALLAVAARRPRPAAAGLGLAGGLCLGALLFGTYLGAVLLIVPAAVLADSLLRRNPGVLAAAGGAVAGAAVVTLAFLAAGFWWFDGMDATREQYLLGSAQFRTWGYFGYANLAAALIAIGPAVFAGLLRLRDRRIWLLAGAGLVAVAVSHLSQYTKAEVERIWLLFYPFIAVAAASLFVVRGPAAPIGATGDDAAVRRHRGAAWVAVQASCTIVLQAALVSKW